MTISQIELLVGIQALMISGAKQTGLRILHDTRGDSDKRGTYFVSSVRVYDDNLEVLHKTEVMVGSDGRDDPGQHARDHERTLEQQRDELAEFIATHRKQEVAA